MKTCKIVQIHDATGIEMVNGNRHYMEEFAWAERIVNKYLEAGYEVKQMISNIDPAMQKEGVYTFYRAGFTIYLEKEGEDTGTIDFSEEQIDNTEEINDIDMLDIDSYLNGYDE